MATIDELMTGKKPGKIKIRLADWSPLKYFIPYFRSCDNFWHGLSQDKEESCYLACEDGWVMYEEGVKFELDNNPDFPVFAVLNKRGLYISRTVLVELEKLQEFVMWLVLHVDRKKKHEK